MYIYIFYGHILTPFSPLPALLISSVNRTKTRLLEQKFLLPKDRRERRGRRAAAAGAMTRRTGLERALNLRGLLRTRRKNDAPSSTGIAPRKGKVQCRKEKSFEQSYKTGKTYKHKGEEITKIPEEKYHKEAEAEAGTDHPFLGNDARYYFL